jgi:Neuraminidase (sialidase)
MACHRRGTRRLVGAMLTMPLALGFTVVSASASGTLLQISHDPYTNSTSQHATEVEPGTFAWESTIVMAAQAGRFFSGGASNIAVSTSTDGGATWTQQYLPGITKYDGGSFDRVSDAAVAYDAKHHVWLVSALAISNTGPVAFTVVTSRSLDGGLTWTNPVTTASFGGLDKNWIVCDNTASSLYYGHCYTEFDDNGDSNRIYMTASTDGGLSWGAPLKTADNATGIGGQPLVQPGGRVIVPMENGSETAIISFTSDNGGVSWNATQVVSAISRHNVAANLRTSPLPSAQIDKAGKVYVVWQDCRFRPGCSSNDIVLTKTSTGTTWTTPVQVPIDPVMSTVDHFIPGLAVDQTTRGRTAHLALAYYFYPVANCTASTCKLKVGYVSSSDGGATWTPKIKLAGAMKVSWIADTSQGRMVGDYISSSFVAGTPVPTFAVATAPSGSVFSEAIYTRTGLAAGSSSTVAVDSKLAAVGTTVPLRSGAATRR